jgi:hypothetical protein
MKIDIFSFGVGFFIALVFCSIMIAIAFEVRKKRALAFIKRFAVISEGLSSLKALAFRVSGQLKRVRHHYQGEELSKKDLHKLKQAMDGLTYIFDSISAGMMPPTEEIAMEALQGRRSSSEHRAYEDSVKFRDDVRRLRQLLETQGLDGIGRHATSGKKPFLASEKESETPLSKGV